MIPSALVLLVAASGGRASAQHSIVPDGTLTTPSVVTRVDASGTTTYTITGGTLRSHNQVLFHSFSAFGLHPNEIGSFLNPNTVQTVFSRVTGGSPSLIEGLIQSNGSANLYLINPQGIIFGPTGAIQVGGSFVATTANELQFGKEKFLAGMGATGDAPLITANITPGLQFGSGGAQLKVAGKLEVRPGNTIRLAAGPNDSVEVSGALQAPAGSIQIDGGAPITISGTLLNVNTGPGSGGSISLQGSTVTLQDGGKVISRSTDGGSSAAISVDTGTLNLMGGSQLISETSGGGAGGSIQLNSSTPQDLAITFSGDSLLSTSTSQAASGGGNGGGIQLGTASKTLSISGPGFITTETLGTGQGGFIDLKGSSIKLDQGVLATTQTSAAGNGGTIHLSGNSISLDQAKATTETSGSGDGGTILLSANSISLSNGATASVLTSSSGAGGLIAVDTGSLTLNNTSKLSSEASSTGQAGAIGINTATSRDLRVVLNSRDSEITASTSQAAPGGGTGGDISMG
ncbi:MAG: filamentous hemagglutinin N-terminal domain-containing protein, partial [Synechococcaceae cyanobacterium]